MPNLKAPRKPSKLSQGKAREMDNGAKTSEYKRSAPTTNRNPHQDKAVDSDANEPPEEPQRGPKVPRAAQLKAVDRGTKKPQVKPQPWPEIAQAFITMLNMGLDRMLDIFATLGTLFVTLAPPLSKVLALFALINIFHAAFESACKISLVPSAFPSYFQSSDDNIQRFNALENIQARLVHVQALGASGLTLPMQLEYSKNVVREVAGIVDHSKVPSRDKIVDHLTKFWQLIDNTIDSMGDFLQGIDRMVDSAITRNEITLRNLRNAALKRTSLLTTKTAIRRQYPEHLDKLTAEIDRLLLDSQLQEGFLKRMASIQWDIHNVIVGDNNHVTEQDQEVQGRFWALFGRYKNLLDDYKQQAAVLQQLDEQRKWAVDLVSDITVKLKELKSNLGDLRYRIREPGLDLSGDMDFQIAIIEKSLNNLYAGRAKSLNEKQKIIADIRGQIDRKRV